MTDGILSISEAADGDGRRVTLAGEFNLYTSARQWHPAAVRLLAGGAGDVALDLTGVAFIDSAGLANLITLHRALAVQGRTLTVWLREGGQVSRVLAQSHLDGFLRCRRPGAGGAGGGEAGAGGAAEPGDEDEIRLNEGAIQ